MHVSVTKHARTRTHLGDVDVGLAEARAHVDEDAVLAQAAVLDHHVHHLLHAARRELWWLGTGIPSRMSGTAVDAFSTRPRER